MIAHLLRALFRAADARIDRMVAAALDDTTAVMDATAGPPVFDDFGYRTGRAATPGDLAYHELLSEVILDNANEWLHDNGDTLPESWLLLEVPDVRAD